MGGIIRITVTAIALPDRAIPPAVIELITYGRVLSCSLKIVPLGTTDHIPWNENNKTVIHAGFIMGITTLQYIVSTPAPSILAASNKVFGTLESINCFIRKQLTDDGIAGKMYAQ